MNADKALELARLAYPNDENLRVTYMLGLNAGAEWQKSQMLKDAVEASVNTYELTPGGSAYVEFVADMSTARFKLNDKVRIVVLKEEE